MNETITIPTIGQTMDDLNGWHILNDSLGYPRESLCGGRFVPAGSAEFAHNAAAHYADVLATNMCADCQGAWDIRETPVSKATSMFRGTPEGGDLADWLNNLIP